ncbi:MAG: Diaminopimelate decarboxylase [Alphaproteobacteria bacterium MarineAlpha9_Bin4]|nr:diaminopimelate decarboxylase [Pelagibacterales bacterium]PPR27405.1 MAG: Diaminopimelate decarboxylase [Alphaproteobacteria bacterium MarineAlpha9_Bin4]|tara:strand:+ start:1883 stop:3151 length:1269 start_codon:yes stop_codon:yes gene_type:complete
MEGFSYNNKKLHCEQISIEKICKKIDTPFYLYSSKGILSNFNALSNKLKNCNVLIAYAVKANSNISILRLLAKKGAGADVVSYGELIRAIKAGIPGKKIVFSGVGKTDLEISKAIDHKILQFNIESLHELHTIEKISREKNIKANIAVRINPDIEAGGHPKISTGKKTDKFGISITEALKVYKLASDSSFLNIVGVDMHIGSQILQIKPFNNSFKKIERFCKKLESINIKIKNIDLGGGLGVNYSDKKNVDLTKEYTNLIKNIYSSTKKKIIIEPGRFIVANAGILVTKVIYKKKNDKKNFIVVDAGMNDFLRPALYDARHNVKHVIIKSNKSNSDFFDIVGPICESADVVAENANLDSDIKKDDLLFIDNVGAYGATMSSTYNSRSLIPEILVHKKMFYKIRNKMEADDFIKLEKIPNWLK